MKQAKATVIANDEIMPGNYLTQLDCPPLAPSAQPGQFVMVRCGGDMKYQLRRPLSIHQLDGKRLGLLFNVVGEGTRWLSQRKTGERVDILGPLGNGFTVYHESKNLLMVAGGIGITPLVFLANKVIKQEKDITLLLGAPTANQLYPQDLLPAKTKLVTTTEDGSAGKKGLITDLLPDFTSDADQIFACGPADMYKTMARMPELSNKSVQISLEVRMGCGLGVCYGCTVKTRNGLRQVCKDGPIFELDEVLWGEFQGV